MRIIAQSFAVACLLAVASCNSPTPSGEHGTLSGDRVVAQTSTLWKAKFDLNDPALRNLPEIGAPSQPNSKGYREVEVRNVGETILVYWGYGPDRPQEFSETMGEEGWETEAWAWCGTGLEEYTIPPGGSATFQLLYLPRPEGSKDVRVLTGFTEQGSDRRSYVVLTTQTAGN